MNQKIFLAVTLMLLVTAGVFAFSQSQKDSSEPADSPLLATPLTPANNQEAEKILSPMAIETLRQREYPGGDFVIERTLPNGTNYEQFVASYQSEGLKIYGLLTIPLAPKPEGGFPAIIFVHGYIPPKEYSTTGNYPTYQATLARAGFVTFKPDLRGHGDSEGEPVSAHFSEKCVVDTLFALSYLRNHEAVNAEKIGYWGHSNGGEIGLRVAVIDRGVKVYSLWAGVVGSSLGMFETYNEKIPFLRDAKDEPLLKENGLPSQNSEFWKTIDPYSYLHDITAPIELQHGTRDASVPIELSLQLESELKKHEKAVALHQYLGDDHNIGQNYSLAWQRTIAFYRENL